MYRLSVENLRQRVQIQNVGLATLSVVALGLWVGWYSAPTRMTFHVPPDLRNGAVVRANEVPPATVYTFAYYILQQVNYWPKDGQKDYAANIYRYSVYFTPRFQEEMIKDVEERGRKGELLMRLRTVHEVTGHGYEERRVDVLGNGAWVVWLDLDINESVKGLNVKSAALRYPVRVVSYDVSPEQNPYGLALDGYVDEGPRRLTDAELKGGS